MCICAPDHPLAEEQTVTIRQLQEAGSAWRPAVRPPCPRGLFEIQGRAIGSRNTSQILFV